MVWARPSQSLTIRAPCQSGIKRERERERPLMPWFSTRPSIPAEIFSLAPYLAHSGLVGVRPK